MIESHVFGRQVWKILHRYWLKMVQGPLKHFKHWEIRKKRTQKRNKPDVLATTAKPSRSRSQIWNYGWTSATEVRNWLPVAVLQPSVVIALKSQYCPLCFTRLCYCLCLHRSEASIVFRVLLFSRQAFNCVEKKITSRASGLFNLAILKCVLKRCLTN